MKRITVITCVMVCLVGMLCCKKEVRQPDKTDGTAPAAVTSIHVTNLPGAVTLTYILPEDPDLFYVKAEYTSKDGVTRGTKATKYTNTLTLEGFGDTSNYEVKMYTVDRSENSSAPVIVTVKPLIPPVLTIRQSIQVVPDFGGINIKFTNATEDNIAIVVLAIDSMHEFVPYETYYTKLKEGGFSIRGFDSVKTKFGVYIRDRWNNRSDTLLATLTPIYEKALDKNKFKSVFLPGDVAYGWGLPIPNLWDGVINPDVKMWHSANSPMPMWITFDLGVTARLSRITLWQRPSNAWAYQQNNPRFYEIWGSTNPAADGSWTGWTKLIYHEVIKPSGQPVGNNTQDDLDAAARGEETTVPLTAPPVRYIRLNILENWSKGDASNVAEMSFWGNPQ